MNTAPATRDFFISHASADKARYIEPLVHELDRLKLTYWLDAIDIAWGDPLAAKINEGLAKSRMVLLCLSEAFLGRPWTELEMSAALSASADGKQKVLPLILNAQEQVFQRYPLIRGLMHHSFDEGLPVIGTALAALAGKPVVPEGEIPITIESVHTGVQVPLSVSPRVSVKWLSDRARLVAGLKEEAQTGAYEDLKLRWVLVDAKAEGEWKALSRRQQQQVHAMLMPEAGLSVSRSSDDRMSDLGIYPGIVFHLVAVPDEAAQLPRFRAPERVSRFRRRVL